MRKILLILFLALAVPVTQARADIAANAARDVYTGNGTTTAFVGTFKILTSANVNVYLDNVLQTLTTHYTLTGVGNDAGFTVTFLTAPATGVQVLLLRNQPIEQTSSYGTGAVSPSQIERDFDRQTAINQQQQEEINRSLRLPRTTTPTAANTVLPAPSADLCLAWNTAGTGLVNIDCGGTGGVGTGTVTSVSLAGTANQITVTGASPVTGAGGWTLSIPTNPTLPGTTTGTFTGNLTGNVTGNVTGSSGSTTGNAATATALAANGANCAAGQSPLGVDASGAVEGCFQAAPSTAMTLRVCGLIVGDGTNVMADADFAPFKNGRCYIPYAATIVEIVLQGDAGTPTVMVQRRRDAATLADLLSGNLAGAGTTETCAAVTISTACLNGTTSSGTITLANRAIAAGDWIEIKSGVAGGVAKNIAVMIVMTVD